MPTAQQLVDAGYIGYQGWGDAEANADFNATGGSGKTGGGGGGSTSGGSSGSGNLPKFEFDQSAADKAAIEELRPYYEKLLKIYNGDIALAKKRMEQDYERGLRYKKEDTQTGLGDIEQVRAERDRKFKIAMGDLDQEMNARGLYTSGIRTTEQQESKADELFQQTQLDNQARDLAQSEKRYIEGADVEKTRFLEEKGFSPTGVEGYMSEPEKYAFEQKDKMAKEAAEMARLKRQQRFTDWQAGVAPIATATPANYSDLVNNALKLSGLPTS